jgi:tRNA threonylcarbamoyladenosine biosynthesis protein TsaB
MSVIAIDAASRARAWLLLTDEEGAILEQRDMPGGELDRALPALLAALLGSEVTAAVVLTGPGSYTGVRAGMAAALGLAAARNLPLHGLGNMAALAQLADVPDGVEFSAVSDAGRGGVYVAHFVRRGSLLEQVSPLQRVAVAEAGGRRRVFATAEIEGLPTQQVDPVRVLASAVPRALALPPLPAPGLRAIHAEPAAGVPPGAEEGTRKAL